MYLPCCPLYANVAYNACVQPAHISLLALRSCKAFRLHVVPNGVLGFLRRFLLVWRRVHYRYLSSSHRGIRVSLILITIFQIPSSHDFAPHPPGATRVINTPVYVKASFSQLELMI